MRRTMRECEIEIARRSMAAELSWSSDKVQQSMTGGYKTSLFSKLCLFRVFAAIDWGCFLVNVSKIGVVSNEQTIPGCHISWLTYYRNYFLRVNPGISKCVVCVKLFGYFYSQWTNM